MAEYIEREALIKLAQSKHYAVSGIDSPFDAVRRQGKLFREAVDECPAVDVVPRAEVDELLDTIACLEIDKENAKSATVRKMQEMLKEALNYVARWSMHGDSNEYFIIGKAFIDQIAEEMLKGEEQ